MDIENHSLWSCRHALSLSGNESLPGVDDVGISDSAFLPRSAVAVASYVAAPAYGVIPPATDEERQTYLEIEDREHDRVVTAIVFFSPSNKRNPSDREQYLAKRREVLRSEVHLVEVDLLRGGERMPVENLPDCDYCAIVSRSYERPAAGIWAWRLREPVPRIPIPLDEGDDDVLIDLKPLIERIHDRLGFADYLYRGTPRPPLSAGDLEWTTMLLEEVIT